MNNIVIKVTLTGKEEVLRDAVVSACHHYSLATIKGNQVFLNYITETSDYDSAFSDVMDCIDVALLESLGIEIDMLAQR